MNILDTDIVVKHFKRETIEDKSSNKYLYLILGDAIYTTTGRKIVLYQSLEDNTIYGRPLEEFVSEVDHIKYPSIKQRYRFEIYTGED